MSPPAEKAGGIGKLPLVPNIHRKPLPPLAAKPFAGQAVQQIVRAKRA